MVELAVDNSPRFLDFVKSGDVVHFRSGGSALVGHRAIDIEGNRYPIAISFDQQNHEPMPQYCYDNVGRMTYFETPLDIVRITPKKKTVDDSSFPPYK